MCFLARQVLSVRPQEGFPRESPSHGVFVAARLFHPVFQHARQEARDALLLASSFEPDPAGNIFFHGHRDVSQAAFHDTSIVLHGERVNQAMIATTNGGPRRDPFRHRTFVFEVHGLPEMSGKSGRLRKARSLRFPEGVRELSKIRWDSTLA